MRDTSPEIEAKQREMIMSRSPAERAHMAANSFEAAQRLVWASLPTDLSRTEKRIQLFLRFYEKDFEEEQTADIIQAIRDYDETHGESS